MFKNFSSTKLFKTLVIVLIFGMLVLINPSNFFDGVRGAMFRVAYPFQKTFYILSTKVADGKNLIFSIGQLKNENESLIEENARLISDISLLKDIREENEILREQVGLLPREEFELEAAQIIGQNAVGSGSWFVIDKGHKDGIEEGMPVIVSKSVLIGKIGKVFANTAQINLLTNPESVINAVVSSTEAKGIIKGEHGLGLVMDMILQTDILNEGDNVVTSGLNEEMPRGLFVGKIQQVSPSQDHLFQQALITNPVKFSKLRYVFVIKNY